VRRFERAVVGLVLVAWLPGLAVLAEAWRAAEFATHGFLVPFVALWAATAHRETLAALPVRPALVGRIALAVCALAYLAALVVRQASLLGVVFVATVVALVLALRGPRWVSCLRFPLFYLVFMIPLPPAWVMPLIVELQLIVSTTAVRGLQLFGIPIFREGNVLTLPGDVSLFVAEACSGITSLITLIPIGVFIAYFTESSFRRRLVLVLAVLPIALAGNLARVVLTVLLAIRVDVEYATKGPLHEWAGIATYVVGCLCLLGLGAAMRRIWPDPDSALAS
jgi:exosortase